MQRLTLRLPTDLLRRLDEMVDARGFNDRSQAVRAAIREAAMEPEERQTVPDREELLRLLGDSARDGNVTAMKALLEEHRRDDGNETTEDPFADFDDELAERRQRRAAG